MSSTSNCPICNKAAKPRSENPSFPFCGPRCKTIDLGKWLNEEYRVPTDEAEDAEIDDVRPISKTEKDVRH